VELLKSDALGRVERLVGADGPLVRRLACGGRILGSRWVARLLMGRERRALRALAAAKNESDDGLGVPQLVDDEAAVRAPDADGRVPRAGDVLLRTWIPGVPLHRTRELPQDFFDLLDALVIEVHRRGVCHNDLHKEQNILVGEDGFPSLVDFQLASVHRRVPRARADEDLRHVQKHRRRYTRDGRGPYPNDEDGAAAAGRGAGQSLTRGRSARLWRRFVKPPYRALADRLGRRDWEERRPSSGPWPRWTPPVGRRPRPS
jgi:hypothetical protein